MDDLIRIWVWTDMQPHYSDCSYWHFTVSASIWKWNPVIAISLVSLRKPLHLFWLSRGGVSWPMFLTFNEREAWSISKCQPCWGLMRGHREIRNQVWVCGVVSLCPHQSKLCCLYRWYCQAHSASLSIKKWSVIHHCLCTTTHDRVFVCKRCVFVKLHQA